MRLQSGLAWLLLACAAAGWGAHAMSPGFLIISSPRNSKVSWVRLPENGSFVGVVPETLVDIGLMHPQGIAVDQKRKRLLITDPDVQKILSYQLHVEGDTLRVDGNHTVLETGIESRWVAVDGNGNVFFSGEPQNLIFRVPSVVGNIGSFLAGADVKPQALYGGTLPQVNSPGGVAVDNFHIYWTNKHYGMQTGSVVRASEAPVELGSVSSVNVLAQNSQKCYGICLALSNVFYTDAENRVYGVKKAGGAAALVTSALTKPRGCSWDGDGTVYVADRGLGAVYSFAGTAHKIRSTVLTKSFDFEDAFGLAFLASSSRGRLQALSAILVAPIAVTAAVLLP